MCKANDGMTPLHSTCYNSGNLKVICYLIEECECDPMSRNNGRTPLDKACAMGHLNIVQSLIT